MGSAAAYARASDRIALLCRGDADARTLRLEALAAIRRAVGFDAYAWLITDPETSVGSAPLADVPCLPQLPQAIRLKYLTAVNRWTRLPCGAVSLSAATGGRAVPEPDVAGAAMPVPGQRPGLVGVPGPLWLLGIPGPVAHSRITAIPGPGYRVPRPHRRAAHRGTAAQPGQDLCPRHRRRADARRPGRAAAVAGPGRAGADPADPAVPAGPRPARRRRPGSCPGWRVQRRRPVARRRGRRG